MNDSPCSCNPMDPIMLDACVFRRYIGLDRLEISSKLQLRFDSEIGLIFRRNVHEDDSLHGNSLHGDFSDQTNPTTQTQTPRPNPRSHFFSNFSPFPYRPLSIYTVVLVIVLAHTQHDNVRKRYTFHNSNSYTTLYTISLLANTVHNNNDSKSCGWRLPQSCAALSCLWPTPPTSSLALLFLAICISLSY